MNQSNLILSIVATGNEKFFSKRHFTKKSLSNFLSAMSRFKNAFAVDIDKNINNLTPI